MGLSVKSNVMCNSCDNGNAYIKSIVLNKNGLFLMPTKDVNSIYNFIYLFNL